MRLSNTLFVLCSALTLPACLAATGTESSDPALVGNEVGNEAGYDFGPNIELYEGEAGAADYAGDFDPGFGHDFGLGPSVDVPGDGTLADFNPGFEPAYNPARNPHLEPECGCVFPSRDPDVSVATVCGEAVCFEEQTYFCTHEGLAVTIGTCAGANDGAFDLTDYDFPEDEGQPSSCQGDAGTCDGDDAPSCEAKAGCTFMASGECLGAPLSCASRNQSACTSFGEGCFHVNPFED